MILIFDTETTGLTLHPDAHYLKAPRMIEFGAVGLDPKTGEEVEDASIMIDPGEPITAEITKITGITDADVAGAGRFIDVFPALRALFARSTAVIAHNLPFDRAIVRGELRRLPPELAATFVWPGRELCTVGAYAPDWGRNPRLVELYESVMGRKLAQTHRALDDARALVEIVRKEALWRYLN